MVYETIKLPSFPETVFVSVFENIDQSVLNTVKSKLIEGDENYDFCFINVAYVISREHLLSAVYRSMSNYALGQAKANSLNAEIIFNMSPVNKISEALKRFGVDTTKSGHLICIKVVREADYEELNGHLQDIFTGSDNVSLTDEFLLETTDIPKFKKVYGIAGAKYTEEPIQGQLTRMAIASCLLRGV